MWFEIIPAYAIIAIAMAFPHASAYVFNKLALGNMYRRALYTPQQRKNYLRDRRLTDSPYIVNGLDCIPDEEEPEPPPEPPPTKK